MLSSTTSRLALKVVLALLILAACFHAIRPSAPQALAAVKANGFGASSYGAAIAGREKVLEVEAERAILQPASWLALERQAMARFNLAKLAGDFAGMDQAYDELLKARQMAPAGSGPNLSAALLAFAMHKLDDSEAALDAIEGNAVRPSPGEQSEMLGLRGDLAFYRGDYAQARALYVEALALDSHPGLHVRLANWYQRMGDLDAALASFDDAAKSSSRVSPELASTLFLYAGGAHLKRGNWDEATDLFERADNAFSGYWLTRAHLAQMMAARGDLAAAETQYRKILKDHDEPSVMAALAPVLDAQGKRREAGVLAERAERIFMARAEKYPEAFADHVLDGAIGAKHPSAALQAARMNQVARPYGDAKVGMARALLANGQPQQAREILDRVHRSGWRSTEQYLATVTACEMLDDKSCVRQARKRATAFNRMAMAEGSDYLAFGNH